MTIEDVEAAIGHGNRIVNGPVERVNGHEHRTRYSVIDPIIRSLGWDISNPDECEVEFPPRGKQSSERADYALFVDRDTGSSPIVIIEAKSIGSELTYEDEAQLAGYVRGIGSDPRLGIAVLTNGREWLVYDLNSKARYFSTRFKDTKFVGEVEITENQREAASFLNKWLSKERWSGPKTPVRRR